MLFVALAQEHQDCLYRNMYENLVAVLTESSLKDAQRTILGAIWEVILTIVAVYVAKYLKGWLFPSREYTDIPTFTVSVPKPAGGTVTPTTQVLAKECITCYNPSTMEILGTAPVMTPEQVVQSINKARAAQKEWAKTSFAERRRVLRVLLNYIVTHQDEINQVSIMETGKTAVDSAFGEVFMTCEKIKWIVENSEELLKREYRPSGMLMMHKQGYIDYVPFGVIGLIIPWNFPFHNVFSHVTTALMTGNSAVVKVSEWASWSSVYIERLTQNWLKAAGHNPDLIQFVTGYGESGSALVANVNKVLFIGSPQVGKKVMETASKNLVPVTLELGGKDPYIVCDDADMTYAVKMALRGAYLNCGQNCLSAERFYVYEKVYDEFINSVLKQVPTMKQGPGAPDIGAINMPAQFQKYIDLLDDAVKKGAKILLGGKPNTSLNGHFFPPTLLVNCNHTMRIMKEECFGPIMTVMKVTSDEEVVKLANDSEYGLACSIFSKNYARAHKIAEQIQAGGTVINDWGQSMLLQSMPFGGVKTSGFGKFNGPEGIRDFCIQKTCVTDKFGFVLPPPDALFYPTSTKVHQLVELFITILYARTLTAKVGAGLTMVKKIITKDV